MSGKTLEAYARDVRQFLAFLADISAAAVARRACEAHAAGCARLHGGATRRRHLRAFADAGARRLRSFARFLERNGKGRSGRSMPCARRRCRRPCRSRSLIASAKRIADADLRAGEDREPWIFARDAAVLALLYGSGLRISEALASSRRMCRRPGRGDAITVTGKGNKQRMVPVLPQVTRRSPTMSRSAPTTCRPDGPLFVGAAAGRCRRASCSCDGTVARRAGLPDTATPHALRHSFATHLLGAAATCAPSRNCSATPRCRPRRSTRRSTPNGCSKSIAARIPRGA